MSLVIDIYRMIRRPVSSSSRARRIYWNVTLLRWWASRFRALYVAADNWKERASLARFALAHLLAKGLGGGDTMVYLHGTAHVVGLDCERKP